MSETTAVRTLVKSAPELWAACSDAESLARHLGAFGEIKITRLEPETTVAWEGDRASGTVMLEQSGWGTKVTMTASTVQEQPIAETPVVEEIPAPPSGFFARLVDRLRPRTAASTPATAVPVAAVSESDPTEQEALDAALNSLGQAHHRPFSQH